MKGKFVGFNRVQGTKKDGSSYDFHKFYFDVTPKDSKNGLIVENYSTSNPYILSKIGPSDLGKECIISVSKNYLNDIDFI